MLFADLADVCRPLQALEDGKAEVGVGWDYFEYGVVKLVEEVGLVSDIKYIALSGIELQFPGVCPLF